MASLMAMTKPQLPQITEANPRLQLIEDRLGESLANLIAERRQRGVSWRRIALELDRRTGTDVTGETLRLWHRAAQPVKRARSPRKAVAA